ncbi:MAG: proline dehydrogenase family protein, partial [Rhodospirillaceae bacterium]
MNLRQDPVSAAASAWESVLRDYRIDEGEAVAAVRARLDLPATEREAIAADALRLAGAVRASSGQSLAAEAFLQRYSLSSREGIVLMCLAEALLRIPDAQTADALIRDKLGGTQWEATDFGHPLMNAASWALVLTGRLAAWHDADGSPEAVLKKLVARAGEPLVRTAIRHAVQILADQFVAGEDMRQALARAAQRPRYRYSFDMLGEAARTLADAERYFEAYLAAIGDLAQHASRARSIEERAGISVKLSALHPRFQMAQRERVFAELLPCVIALCRTAAEADIPLTIDAEEADRLLLSLEIFERLAHEPSLAGWSGLGLAVQAYQKRALPVCEWVAELAAATQRKIMVRLVKGAYWDTEIKLAQVLGLDGYPVYTRKAATDVSYMACAQILLKAQAAHGCIFPQFATHNCHTVAFIS